MGIGGKPARPSARSMAETVRWVAARAGVAALLVSATIVACDRGAKQPSPATANAVEIDPDLRALEFGTERFWQQPAAEETLRAVLARARQSRDAAALERYGRAWIESQPDSFDGLSALGIGLRARGAYAKAKRYLTRAIELAATPRERESARKELLLALEKNGESRRAVTLAAELLTDDPYDRWVYLRLAAALARLQRSRTESDGAAAAFLTLARKLERGDGEERRAELESELGRSAIAARTIARAFTLRGQMERAREVLSESAQSADPGAIVFLIENLVASYAAPEALEQIERLGAAIGSAHPDVRGWRAMTRALRGESDSAARELESLCRSDSRLVAMWAPRLAQIVLEDLDEPARAARWLELYRRSGRGAGALLLARALVESRQFLAAEEILARGSFSTRERNAATLLSARVRLARGEAVACEDLPKPNGVTDRRSDYDIALLECLTARGAVDERALASARRRADESTALERAIRGDLYAAGHARGAARARHLLRAAKQRFELGERSEGLRLARIAAIDDGAAWRVLYERLDRVEEIFLRREAAAKRREREPTAPPPRTAVEIATVLCGPDGTASPSGEGHDAAR